MAYEMKEGWGNLFKNEDATPENNQPTWKGKAMFEGKVVEVAVWGKKKAKTSEKMICGVNIQKWVAREKDSNSSSVDATPKPVFENEDMPF